MFLYSKKIHAKRGQIGLLYANWFFFFVLFIYLLLLLFFFYDDMHSMTLILGCRRIYLNVKEIYMREDKLLTLALG
jgi:hypothetical protein